jgi:Zn-dependent protease with chaperone function
MSLVHRQEKILFPICLAVSAVIILYVLFFFTLALPLGALVVWSITRWWLGHIRGNGVRVSPHQFGEVYRLAERTANDLGLKKLPAIYVHQGGGALRVIETRFARRNAIILYSDLFELADRGGESELGFILAHHLAAIRRRITLRRLLLAPAMAVPFLGSAYFRGFTYTCDRIAARHQPEGAIGGVLVLAAGTRLYRSVSPEAFSEQVETERGFWVRTAELLSSHPNLPKRVAALRRFAAEADVLAEPELAPAAAPMKLASP